MEDILRYLQTYEAVIYVVLGFAAVYMLFRLYTPWAEWRGAVFGIEREIALRRLKGTLNIFIMLLLFALVEFFLVSFVAPAYPRTALLATPTLDLLATPTGTIEPKVAAASTLGGDPLSPGSGSSLALGTATPEPTASAEVVEEGCLPGKIEWLSPKPGDTISGTVQLMGTVNVPNLGFYKYEFSPVDDTVWSSIAANKEPKVNGEIGFWNTSQIAMGDYLLRLMVYDNQNNPFPACSIQVRVMPKQ